MKANKMVFLVLLTMLLAGCNEQTLLSGLDQKQANEVVAVLQSNGIDAAKQSSAKEGFSIVVDSMKFLDAVNLVNYYDLPSKPRIEISQMFPDDSLVTSPLAEKARLYSAIEQRLEQSLKTLRGVIAASLHLNYDFADVQKKRGQDIHLTAIVRYETGFDDQLLIADVKRFLKNSFSNVDYENISVVMTPAAKFESTMPVAEPRQRIGQWSIVIAVALFGLVSALLLKLTKQWLHHKKEKK